MIKKAAFLSIFALLACGKDEPQQSFAGLSRVSGESPFPASCVPAGQTGINYRSAEVEPFVAVDPTNSSHLIGVWQQDRWSNGGSNGLGTAVSFDRGATWSTGFAAFTTCSGGTAAKHGDFQRASDPWITFGADGTPHHIGFSFNNVDTHTAMLATRSADGGRTWGDPVVLFEETNNDTAIDKESITADPVDKNFVYAVWDRLTGQTLPQNSPDQTGPAWFTRTTDGGATWEPARLIFDPGNNAQTISNQIVVLPDGTLIDFLVILTNINQNTAQSTISILRSSDRGATWSAPIAISGQTSVGVGDPKNNVGIRSGSIVPDIAVDPVSGALYAAWQDSRFSNNVRDGIAFSRSTNGGQTWSAPIRVNAVLTTQAFTPSVAVASDGKVGVTYTDLRDDDASDNDHLLATNWLAISSDGGQTFSESQVAGPFDLRNAARTGEGYFIGDYQGLTASGTVFVPFFAMTNNGNEANRSDILARPPAAGAARFSAPIARNATISPATGQFRAGARRIF